jgi:DNA anti-recombination protein RmuC
VTKRAPTHGRALSQSDAVPQQEIEEISDRIDLLESLQEPSVPISQDELGRILSSFEAQLFELNKSLTKETRANRTTLKTFSDECKKTAETVADLNTELALVVPRRETG